MTAPEHFTTVCQHPYVSRKGVFLPQVRKDWFAARLSRPDCKYSMFSYRVNKLVK